MSTGVVTVLVLVVLAIALGVWFFTSDDLGEPDGRQRSEQETRRAREARTQAQLDALRASQRIGSAFWRASRALFDVSRDERRRDRDGR
ncbi:hypothetical protein [Pseudofrankia sp. BMG5.36]|uniref:hypothetical protein n=1 Tax=Pseudofrankia sp. BMG5.36 TaxID=1834512 RepID=UPI0008DA202E|nr:hypothetical protein [Pseudofrankia sp. BMG5.36]OHV61397.1 hypothetical protein BCD48_39720 [Pseudofrankia sp. BMG5.36]